MIAATTPWHRAGVNHRYMCLLSCALGCGSVAQRDSARRPASEPIPIAWRTAPAAGRDLEVSLVVDGRAMTLGKLRADGEQPGSPKTCMLLEAKSATTSRLMCGYSTELNYYTAELVAGDLVITQHSGPSGNPPIEVARTAVRAPSLAVAPYEQTFAPQIGTNP